MPAQTSNTTWLILPRVFPNPDIVTHSQVSFTTKFEVQSGNLLQNSRSLQSSWWCQPYQDNAEDRRIVTHCYLKANGKRLERGRERQQSDASTGRVGLLQSGSEEFGQFGFARLWRPSLASLLDHVHDAGSWPRSCSPSFRHARTWAPEHLLVGTTPMNVGRSGRKTHSTDSKWF